MKGYIFLCSNATEDECLRLLLFGGTSSYRSQVKKVEVDDLLFLYNYKAGRLHGIFKAVSESSLNIIPHAWNGNFPWQVKVEIAHKHAPLTRADFEKFISFRKGIPHAVLSGEQVSLLLDKFKSSFRLPEIEIDYRKDNPANILTLDGHRVRSQAEATIDNWLFSNRIIHAYEKEISRDKESWFCDFSIPTESNSLVYVELWGLEDEKYVKRKQHKLSLYKKYNLRLVELDLKDLEKLDEVMKKRLSSHSKISVLS